ncbi:hypothetical protein EMIHUDRAFT_364894 [Emiliania huxleyi CCMP1516]|uniref:Uncharacterized protein n=3 Tax=Emiliania huxleyi TaxID=2903 RepID=A0A0D3K7C0_EMIH1|nr:hypothetical protein EMIHUDRAFT_364894 [Emiliania huxleyi CCMP1516]EOD31655.1 hypothetical protein EMIHUDRAFT_364894 [Emiliania huxleyi CCMP1516]|eukprot:XP_005784084.1 hypothetical protein EMIHUDRAFT_364894 [Emiliania huxleyi CCMP1516]
MDDVRFYFTYYDKHLSAPFDAKDFDRLHKFYLRPRHKMDRRGGKKTIPCRMCRNRHGSLWRILEDLRKRARRDLGDEKLARPALYVYLLAYEEYLKESALRHHPAFWVSANEDLTGDAEETIEIADSEDEAAVPSDAVELGGSGSDDDDADPPAPPAVRVKTEQ